MRRRLWFQFLLSVFFLVIVFAPMHSHAAWSNDPRINTPISTAVGEQNFQQTTTDGNGGAIIVWQDSRAGTWLSYGIYARRVDANGNVLWEQDGVAIHTGEYQHYGPQIASDGAGGAIIAWHDKRNNGDSADLYVQRIDATGALQWPAGGVRINLRTGAAQAVQLVSDDSGGAILVWQETLANYGSDYRLYAQRINSAGIVQWPIDLDLCTAAETPQFPQMVSDGSGGAVIMWLDFRDNTNDVYAQRIDAEGNLLWPSDGVNIYTNGAYNSVYRALVSDDSGGAIFAWQDGHTGDPVNDIHAQRVDASGIVKWAPNGVGISTVAGSSQVYPAMLGDGSGGAIIAWQDDRNGNYDIFAQRVDATGTVQWTPDGVPVSTAAGDQWQPQIASDGVGGAIIIWYGESGGGIYAQRINSNGNVQWTPNDVAIATSDCQKQTYNIISDGNSGAIVTWGDYRVCHDREIDIYAQKVLANGQLPSSNLPEFTLSVSKTGAGNGTILSQDNFINCGGMCSHVYTQGTLVTLTAPTIGSSVFMEWSGGCSGNGICVTTVNADTSVTANFARKGTYSISGQLYMSYPHNSPVGGATVTLTGPVSGTITTGTSGDYSFNSLPDGRYMIAVTKQGYTFSPFSRIVDVIGASVSRQNFRADYVPFQVAHSISGAVTLAGAPMAGITINLTGRSTGVTMTDANGNFSFIGLPNGYYTLQLRRLGYRNTPFYRSVWINNYDVSGQNFTLYPIMGDASTYSISGRVLAYGTQQGLAGVTINLAGDGAATTVTDANGTYAFTGLYRGLYTVMPVMPGYRSIPSRRQAYIFLGNVAVPDIWGIVVK